MHGLSSEDFKLFKSGSFTYVQFLPKLCPCIGTPLGATVIQLNTTKYKASILGAVSHDIFPPENLLKKILKYRKKSHVVSESNMYLAACLY